jgi:hypothetical protein
LEDLKSALSRTTKSSGTFHQAISSNPPSSTAAMFVLPNDVHGWLAFGFYLIVSVLSSGGVVCSGWCAIKFIRNGCLCKVSDCVLEQVI